jgi:thiol-disulfide isomerase/thioredoxin
MCKNNLLFLFLLLVLFLNNFHCSPSSIWTDSDDIIILTNKNFNTKIKQYDVLLVMFYVKWCAYSRRLYPEYEQAGTKLIQNIDYPIYIAKLDCTDDKEAQCSKRYNVKGYPALRIYRYGRFNDEELNYRNRTTDEIVKTMKTLKKNIEQQNKISYDSGQTDGINDEIFKATASTHRMWIFMGLFMILCRFI